MILYMKNYFKKLKQDNKGSFTLEATLVFPAIFFATIALIFLSIVIFERVNVHHQAYIMAERIAFTWDNSYKDFSDGSFPPDKYTTKSEGDGLYWREREFGGSFVHEVFGAKIKGGVLEAKEQQAKDYVTQNTELTVKEVSVTKTTFNPKVTVTLESSLKIPSIADYIFPTNVEVTATASIKDPVDLIRTTDFIFEYGSQIINSIGSGE